MSERFSLANRGHLSLFVGILLRDGALCPSCGYGTRKTSKRWATCKRCGERVARGDGAHAPLSRSCSADVAGSSQSLSALRVPATAGGGQ